MLMGSSSCGLPVSIWLLDSQYHLFKGFTRDGLLPSCVREHCGEERQAELLQIMVKRIIVSLVSDIITYEMD